MQSQINGPVIIQPPTSGYPLHKSVIGMGIALVVIGGLSIVAQIAGMTIPISLSDSGVGLWSGIFFIVTGSFGISAGKTKSKCQIITFLVLSILSASIFAVTLLTIAAIGLDQDNGHHYWACEDYDSWGYYRSCTEVEWGLGLNGAMMFLAVAAGILSIIASAFTCRAFCCDISDRGARVVSIQHTVPQYIPQPQPSQAMVLVPSQDYPGYFHYVQSPGNQRNTAPPPGYDNLAFAEGGQMVQPTVHQLNASSQMAKSDL